MTVDTCVCVMRLFSVYDDPFCFLIENGYIQKAVNYAGEMFIIEEIQLYKTSVPISTLRLSSSKVTRNRFNIVAIYLVLK